MVDAASDEALNDSDKTIIDGVDTGRIFTVVMLRVELTTTATVGDRNVVVRVLDASDDVLFQFESGATQAASLTRNYNWGAGLPQSGSFAGSTNMYCALPTGGIPLQAGEKLQVLDANAVDAAADDMQTHVRYLITTDNRG
jgi:hypothetical protein